MHVGFYSGGDINKSEKSLLNMIIDRGRVVDEIPILALLYQHCEKKKIILKWKTFVTDKICK